MAPIAESQLLVEESRVAWTLKPESMKQVRYGATILTALASTPSSEVLQHQILTRH